MNEKARTIVFNISALLLLAGAGLYLALPVAGPEHAQRGGKARAGGGK